jgi:hypothetical protein
MLTSCYLRLSVMLMGDACLDTCMQSLRIVVVCSGVALVLFAGVTWS